MNPLPGGIALPPLQCPGAPAKVAESGLIRICQFGFDSLGSTDIMPCWLAMPAQRQRLSSSQRIAESEAEKIGSKLASVPFTGRGRPHAPLGLARLRPLFFGNLVVVKWHLSLSCPAILRPDGFVSPGPGVCLAAQATSS